MTNVQIEHLENHLARLTVEVEAERLERAMQNAARRISKKVNIPGFRKGKAPFAVIMQWVGQPAVLEEAMNDLGNEVYREALEQSQIVPYAQGNLEDVKTEPQVVLTFTVPKLPEVALGDYRAIRLDFEMPEVEDSAVNEAIRRLQEQHAVVEAVERPAQLGDILEARVFGEVIHPAREGEHAHDEPEGALSKPEAEAAEGAKAEPHVETFIDDETEILLSEEKGRDFMPGFTPHLVGVKAGESRSFSLSFPDDYEDKRYAGHTFNFRVEALRVQARTLPTLNDDFAKRVSNNEVETLLDLRIQMRANLQTNATNDAKAKYADQIIDKLVENATIQYPEMMVDEYVDDLLDELDRNLRERGLTLAQLKQVQNKDDAALRAEYREPAIKRLKRGLVVNELIRQEQIRVTDSDVDARIDRMSQSFSRDPQEIVAFRRMLDRPETRRNVAFNLMMDRLRERLIAIARGENPPIDSDQPAENPLTMPIAENQITFGAMAAEEAPQAEELPGSEAPAHVESAGSTPGAAVE